MEVGMRLLEKHTNLKATVTEVHDNWMYVKFDDVGLVWVIDEGNYKNFKEIEDVPDYNI